MQIGCFMTELAQCVTCLIQTVRNDCHQMRSGPQPLTFQGPDGDETGRISSVLFLASGLCCIGTHRSVSQQVGHEPVAA